MRSQDAVAQEDGEDPEYDRLQDSLLEDFNFGGGLLQRKAPGPDADGQDPTDQRRTKKEVCRAPCHQCIASMRVRHLSYGCCSKPECNHIATSRSVTSAN